jgi:hypothetical protein
VFWEVKDLLFHRKARASKSSRLKHSTGETRRAEKAITMAEKVVKHADGEG